MEDSPCVFCSIASGAIKSNVVYEDELIIAVLDINPATKGHTIIIPKEHYNSLYEMPQPRYLSLLSVARAIAYALKLSMGCNTVDMIYTQELRKGTLTPHALIHAIPRYNEDTVNYIWQPTQFSAEEAAGIVSIIKKTLDNVKESETPKPVQTVKPAPATQAKPEEKKEEKPVELKKKVVVF